MTVDIPTQEDMEIYIRIPAWSKSTKLNVNGVAIDNIQPGNYAKVKRDWKTGDKITLQLDMRGRVVETGTTNKSIAIVRGPIVLARDTRFEGAGMSAVLRPVTDKEGYINLTAIPNNSADDIIMLFNAKFIPESYTEVAHGPINVTLCDYASAGNGNQSSFFQVWLPQLIRPAEE